MLNGELCFSKSVILDGETKFKVLCKYPCVLRVILIENIQRKKDKKTIDANPKIVKKCPYPIVHAESKF